MGSNDQADESCDGEEFADADVASEACNDEESVDPDTALVEEIPQDVELTSYEHDLIEPDDISANWRLQESRADYWKQRYDLETSRLEQQNSLRPKLFAVASILAGASIAVSSTAMLSYVYIAGDDASATVLVAFTSGAVVETLGILAIVSNYLFPSRKRQNDKKQ